MLISFTGSKVNDPLVSQISMGPLLARPIITKPKLSNCHVGSSHVNGLGGIMSNLIIDMKCGWKIKVKHK